VLRCDSKNCLPIFGLMTMKGFFKYWRGHLLKTLGIFILVYWCISAEEKLKFNWIPVLMLTYVFLMGVSFYVASRFPVSEESIKRTNKKISLYSAFLKKYPLSILLVPGEDGLFFVPVVASGFRLDVLVAFSLIFGLLHVTSRSIRDCLVVSFTSGLILYLVIPLSGILAWTVSHLLCDLIIVAILCRKRIQI